MKVVCCKNCGAKYQLDDSDDISTFECSFCAGDLEPCDEYSSDEDNSENSSLGILKDSSIAYCVNCGLKYKINPNDNILDYECESCGDSLRYLDEDKNEEVDKILEERENQKIRDEIESNNIKIDPMVEKPVESPQKKATNSLKSLSSKIEKMFSEEHLEEIAKEEKIQKEEEKKPTLKKTARTKIPNAVLSKFGKEFKVPKSDNYNILKNYLKDEFYKHVMEYYNVAPKDSSSKVIKPFNREDIELDLSKKSNIFIGIGIIIFLVSIIEIFTIDSGIGIIGIFIGVIFLCYGLYKTRDKKENKKRSKIIREHLLSLSNEYYVFYNVQLPTTKSGINHLVVGPSGIYSIISKKYSPKSEKNSEQPIDTLEETEEDEIVFSNNIKLFKYTKKQTKFPQDNKIKQKSLRLGENLINFLNANGIRNCLVEPLVGFVNEEVVVINMPLTDEDLFIDELIHKIEYGPIKLDSETIDKCAVLLNNYSADCSNEF